MDEYQWDVFISHASEDKIAVVLPLAGRLQEAGFKVWLDQHELKPGYSLREQIDEGLAHSRFGIIILSRAFMRKPWPRAELNAILSRDIVGKIRLIPVWYDVTFKEVSDFSPIIAERFALCVDIDRDIDRIAFLLAHTMLREKIESLTVTGLFLQVLNENPTPRRISDFLLKHPNVLRRALSGKGYWCSGRKALGLTDLAETTDFILGTLTPGTEQVWRVYPVFFNFTDQPICDAEGHESKNFREHFQLIIHQIPRLEPNTLIDMILAQQPLFHEDLIPDNRSYRYESTTPIIVTRRRIDLNPEELTFINQRNHDRSIKIRTFDWLIDACRSIDFDNY